jgi:hypothetical protein
LTKVKTNQAKPRLAHNWATRTPVTGCVLTRVLWLEVLPVFPASNTFCPTSPSLRWVAWVSLPHPHRYYARLQLPLVRLGVLCSRSFTDTLFVPSVRVLSSSSLTLRNPCANAWPAWSPGTPFPGGVTRKQMALPSSQVTPLSSCPALRPRWCPQHSP